MSNDSNISPAEQAAAGDPTTGAGSPLTAPFVALPDSRPSRKWWAARVTALTGWLVAFVEAGYELTPTLVILLITIASEAAISWITPNMSRDLR